MAPSGAETTIARRVRAARERRGMKREELAVASGLSWSAIAQIEAGRRTNLRPQTLAALARTLGVTTDYLVGVDPMREVFEHHALIYDGAQDFVQKAAPLIATAIERGEPTLAVTSRRNIRRLRDHFGADARAVRFEDSKAWYRTPGATLLAYRTFADESIGKGADWLRVIGEPIWPDRSDTQTAFWARYEALLNLAFANVPMTLVCPYDSAALPEAIISHAHCTHRHSLQGDELRPNPEYVDPAQFVLEE